MLKIAFLFLAVADIYHQDYWQMFFKGHQEQYSVYVHSKEGVSRESQFSRYEIPVKVPTTWANSVEAQVALLKEALKDQKNGKFVFLSESTLPLQSFDTVYTTVMADSKSIFSYHKNPHSSVDNSRYSYRNLSLIPAEYRYKTSQWVILNRKHAQLVADDVTCLPKVVQYEADNELYFGTLLASHNLLHEVIPLDMTYVDWQKDNKKGRILPHEFNDLCDKYEANQIVNAINNGMLFMRKFAADIDLTALQPYLAYCPYKHDAKPLKIALYNRCVKDRYKLIRSVLDTYTTPITIFDCGARQGYYSYAMVKDYPAVCMLWEESDSAIERTQSRLLDLHNHRYSHHKVLLFNKSINASEIEELGVCTTFDVVLALDLIELFGRKWQSIVEALLKMGNKVIVEIPQDTSVEALALRRYLVKKEAVFLGDLKEGGIVLSTLYLLHNSAREFSVKTT